MDSRYYRILVTRGCCESVVLDVVWSDMDVLKRADFERYEFLYTLRSAVQNDHLNAIAYTIEKSDVELSVSVEAVTQDVVDSHENIDNTGNIP